MDRANLVCLNAGQCGTSLNKSDRLAYPSLAPVSPIPMFQPFGLAMVIALSLELNHS